MKHFATGALLLCLTGLSACSSAPPSPAPVIIWRGCPRVSSCPIPGSQSVTQGDLLADIRQLEQALLLCGLQIETIKQCQEQHDVKANPVTRRSAGPGAAAANRSAAADAHP
ncbi:MULTISPECIES: Rz1-like lysis system protein LysC [Erwinia]|uniref:Rz1-like lysis system protein LysC n=1 Tax=Erwinia aphidicola TaxID=68334 RepID=A0ABU8DD02_ERWAP|nr:MULTISPECIES: Rz1-like lysis system protein LysC [Erwinia]MDI3442286.1 Rz1-like lysis system protein LysC [Erwinia sp. V90_4]